MNQLVKHSHQVCTVHTHWCLL